MRSTLVFIASLLMGSGVDARPEIWLLSGPECNICSIYDQIDGDRGYGDQLLVDGARIPIRRANKEALPPPLDGHFSEAIRNSSDWPIQLTVAVVDDDAVLYAANIAESVDWRDGVIAPEFMDPPASEDEASVHDYGFDYAEYFRRQINLEYFLARATGSVERPYKQGDVRVSASDRLANSKRVSIWGTAVQPAHNGLFISTRIRQLIERVERDRLFLAYANGPDTSRRDTLVLEDDDYRFVKSELAADFSGDFAGVDAWFNHIASSSAENHLIIHVGHYGPTGMPVWGHALTLPPEAIGAAIDATDKDIVLVSGGCHSGLMAGAAQCGFFAAHPEVIATGCQRSAAAIEASDDYLKYVFLSQGDARDSNRDGQVSFREAHWYAATRVERHNIVYSDIDRDVDRYFADHADSLPTSMTIRELQLLVDQLPQAQRAAFRQLRSGLAESESITLNNHVELNRQALERLDDAVEASSERRNAEGGLSYPLNLVSLARQAIYVQRGRLLNAEIIDCGDQAIAGYL